MATPEAIFPLDQDPRFGIVHHRKLNTHATLHDLLPVVDALPHYTHIAEGDICWAPIRGRYIFYFYHPHHLTDTLDPAELQRQLDAGTLWTLDRALDATYDPLLFIIELKTGTGDRAEALRQLVATLQARRPGRYWIDAFHLADLKHIKAADPTVATSMHTKALGTTFALKTSMELPPIAIKRIANLTWIDLFTLTYKTSPQRLLPGYTTATTIATLATHGKRLVYGGVATPTLFHQVKDSGAKAGYIKFPWQKLTP